METGKNQTQIFLVLVPHRDTRIELRKHSESLFKNGLSNVYPFPHAAPLASLSKPLNDDELKQIARVLREKSGKEKFYPGEISSISILINKKDLSLFGPKLELDATCTLGMGVDKIKSIFSPSVIGSFMVPENTGQQLCVSARESSSLAFRAAAVANMHWKPARINGEFCYKWKIEKLFWLPRLKGSLHK